MQRSRDLSIIATLADVHRATVKRLQSTAKSSVRLRTTRVRTIRNSQTLPSNLYRWDARLSHRHRENSDRTVDVRLCPRTCIYLPNAPTTPNRHCAIHCAGIVRVLRAVTQVPETVQLLVYGNCYKGHYFCTYTSSDAREPVPIRVHSYRVECAIFPLGMYTKIDWGRSPASLREEAALDVGFTKKI